MQEDLSNEMRWQCLNCRTVLRKCTAFLLSALTCAAHHGVTCGRHALSEPRGLVHKKTSSLGSWIAKQHPFYTCASRPGPDFGGYTWVGVHRHLASLARSFCTGHNLQSHIQQPCWSNVTVIRILFGFYLLHRYFLSAYYVSPVVTCVHQYVKDPCPQGAYVLAEFTI